MTAKAKGQRTHRNDKLLKPQECFGLVLRIFLQMIPIRTQGKWKARNIFGCLIGMCAEGQSRHSIQNIVSKIPSETSLKHHLKKITMEILLKLNVAVLTSRVLEILPKNKPLIFAIDYTDDPYYGKMVQENEDYVIRGKPKKSTTTFYRYGTLYVMFRDRKFTLSLFPVKKGFSDQYYVAKMLQVIKQLGLDIEVLLLDRGFYSTSVMKLLKSNNIPFIIPVKKHGKNMKRLLKGRHARFGKYTMGGKDGPLELMIAIYVTYLNGRYKKHKALNLGYLINGIDLSPKKIHDLYRKRFGIETSYRMRNIVRPRTSSRDPTLRYLYALISMSMKNIWVMINWQYFTKVRPGPRKIVQDAFPFDRFRIIIWNVFSKRAKIVLKIQVLRDPG